MVWVECWVVGELLVYLVGEVEFCGCVFQVLFVVLILWLEIEVLIDLVLEKLCGVVVFRVFDFGIGLGIVVILLVLECFLVWIVVVDILKEVFFVVCNNVGWLGVRVDFCEGDWFVLLVGEKFDLIVVNLFYVVVGDLYFVFNGLLFELQLVLIDGVDGLFCICQIVVGVLVYFKVGGWLFFEYGYD